MDETKPSLTKAVTAQIVAATLAYEAQLNLEVKYNGSTYQADPKSYEAMLAASIQTDLPADFYWLDKDNNSVAFSLAQMKELVGVVFAARLGLFKTLQDRKARYRAATAIKDLTF